MIERVKNAGIVGMGGATFPTHVKITSGIGKVSTVIINGAGVRALQSPATTAPCWSGPRRSSAAPSSWPRCSAWTRSFIGVEDNKQNGIDRHEQGHRGREGPRGGGAPCAAATPRAVRSSSARPSPAGRCPPGGLPADIGCAVFNINTTCAIFRALTTGMPVVRKIVTGLRLRHRGAQEPGVPHRAPPVSALLDACRRREGETPSS